MTVLWSALAEAVGRDVAMVESEALLAWFTHEGVVVADGLNEYRGRYGVETPDALVKAIRAGAAEGHPAWEDSIDWSNLVEYWNRLIVAVAEMKLPMGLMKAPADGHPPATTEIKGGV